MLSFRIVILILPIVKPQNLICLCPTIVQNINQNQKPRFMFRYFMKSMTIRISGGGRGPTDH